MTEREAIDAYIERFGGFPYFLFLGATEEVIVKSVVEALKTGKEITKEL